MTMIVGLRSYVHKETSDVSIGGLLLGTLIVFVGGALVISMLVFRKRELEF